MLSRESRQSGDKADRRKKRESFPLVRIGTRVIGSATSGAARPADRVPLPESDRGAAGQFFDHGAAEHFLHHDVGVAHFARRRLAALLAIPARIEDAALQLPLRDGFADPARDALAAIVADGRDGKQLIPRLERDRFEPRFFRQQARDIAVNAMRIFPRRFVDGRGLHRMIVGHCEQDTRALTAL